MSRPTVSIALCTFNGARYLRDQLQSILAQTRPADEMVVCDDGSTDETLETVERFATEAPFRVRVLCNSTRLGSSKNFEQAIGLCEGSLIFLCDQDDVWLPTKIEVVESHFRRALDVDAIFTDADMVDEALRPLSYTLWEAVRFSHTEQLEMNAGNAFRVLLHHNVVTGATMAFRSRCRPLLLPVPECGVHDAWAALLLSAVGKIAAINDRVVLYRQHAENQIGARKLTLRERIARASEAGSQHKETLCQVEAAAARLATFANREAGGRQSIEKLEAKARHLRGRIGLLTKSPGGMGVLLHELLSGRYHRYSMGSWSVAHDLIRRLVR